MSKIPFGKPIIDFKEKKIISEVLDSGIFVHGLKSKEFEKNFKKFTGAKDAITVSSCTAGMHLFYFSLNIGKGDEVIIPAQTHVATAHAIELSGAKPIFIDSDYPAGNINIDLIEKKITKKTKAITVVHYLGNPVNMIKLKSLVKKYTLYLLEDCALALGANINKKHVGLFGDAGFFSFYPVKHITTAEGGMIILKNNKFSKLLRKKKAFGYDKSLDQRTYPGLYDVDQLGFNYLEKKLKYIKEISVIPNFNKNLKGSYYCLSIMLSNKILKKRFDIIKYLKEKGIGSSIYYPHPVPRLKYYQKKYRINKKNFIIASEFSDKIICLPIGPHVSKNNLDLIASSLKKIILKYSD